ncbi:TPA: D-arabinose 5-phosphate isomerase, partial [Pseudomonas aeruginosa]
MNMSQNLDFIHSAQRTIGLERDAVDSLLARIGDDFVKACELLLAGKGRVV